MPLLPLEPFIFPDHLTQTPHQQQLQGDLSRVYYPIAAGAPRTPEERLQAGSHVEITGGAFGGTQRQGLAARQAAAGYAKVSFFSGALRWPAKVG
jgi:hypothetical protein